MLKKSQEEVGRKKKQPKKQKKRGKPYEFEESAPGA